MFYLLFTHCPMFTEWKGIPFNLLFSTISGGSFNDSLKSGCTDVEIDGILLWYSTALCHSFVESYLTDMICMDDIPSTGLDSLNGSLLLYCNISSDGK